MNLSHMNAINWSHVNGFVTYEWDILKRNALKCLVGAFTSSMSHSTLGLLDMLCACACVCVPAGTWGVR